MNRQQQFDAFDNLFNSDKIVPRTVKHESDHITWEARHNDYYVKVSFYDDHVDVDQSVPSCDVHRIDADEMSEKLTLIPYSGRFDVDYVETSRVVSAVILHMDEVRCAYMGR